MELSGGKGDICKTLDNKFLKIMELKYSPFYLNNFISQNIMPGYYSSKGICYCFHIIIIIIYILIHNMVLKV